MELNDGTYDLVLKVTAVCKCLPGSHDSDLGSLQPVCPYQGVANPSVSVWPPSANFSASLLKKSQEGSRQGKSQVASFLWHNTQVPLPSVGWRSAGGDPCDIVEKLSLKRSSDHTDPCFHSPTQRASSRTEQGCLPFFQQAVLSPCLFSDHTGMARRVVVQRGDQEEASLNGRTDR